MANESPMLPHLKPGAIITLQFGSAFIAKIQECFQQHCAGHEEDMKALHDRKGDYDSKPLTPWENQAIMYSSLMQAIMKTAEAEGLVEYISMEETLKSVMPKMPTPNGQKED